MVGAGVEVDVIVTVGVSVGVKVSVSVAVGESDILVGEQLETSPITKIKRKCTHNFLIRVNLPD